MAKESFKEEITEINETVDILIDEVRVWREREAVLSIALADALVPLPTAALPELPEISDDLLLLPAFASRAFPLPASRVASQMEAQASAQMPSSSWLSLSYNTTPKGPPPPPPIVGPLPPNQLLQIDEVGGGEGVMNNNNNTAIGYKLRPPPTTTTTATLDGALSDDKKTVLTSLSLTALRGALNSSTIAIAPIASTGGFSISSSATSSSSSATVAIPPWPASHSSLSSPKLPPPPPPPRKILSPKEIPIPVRAPPTVPSRRAPPKPSA